MKVGSELVGTYKWKMKMKERGHKKDIRLEMLKTV